MKDLIQQLHKAFDHRVRLGMMSMLMVREWVSYNEFKEQLDLTDGNLAGHLRVLEGEEFILLQKSFVGRKPLTRYQATPKGRQAFKEHLAYLEQLISWQKQPGKED